MRFWLRQKRGIDLFRELTNNLNQLQKISEGEKAREQHVSRIMDLSIAIAQRPRGERDEVNQVIKTMEKQYPGAGDLLKGIIHQGMSLRDIKESQGESEAKPRFWRR